MHSTLPPIQYESAFNSLFRPFAPSHSSPRGAHQNPLIRLSCDDSTDGLRPPISKRAVQRLPFVGLGVHAESFLDARACGTALCLTRIGRLTHHAEHRSGEGVGILGGDKCAGTSD